MFGIFYDVLKVSGVSTFAAVIIIIARFCLKGSPRWITCALWGIIALRLICPILPESSLSIIPLVESKDDISYYTEEITVLNNSSQSAKPTQSVDLSHTSDLVMVESGPIDMDPLEYVPSQSLLISSYLWIAGVALMVSYGALSYIRLRLRIRDAVLLRDNIRQSEKVRSPFAFGVLKPRIFIPYNLDKKTRKQVILHEQCHIKRLDHIWKLLGFIFLSIHWFNPLMWMSYILFCRDIEIACDEKVIKHYSFKMKKKYATALLKCGISNGLIPSVPVAFGEIGVSVRIKKTLKYKRRVTAVSVFGILLVFALSVCLLTNPVSAISAEFPEEVVSYKVVEDNTIPAVEDTATVLVTDVPAESYLQPVTESVTESATEPLTEPAIESEVIPTEPNPEPYEDDSYTEDSYYEDSYDYDSIYEIDLVKLTLPEYEPTPMMREGENVNSYGFNSFNNNQYYGIDPTKPIKIFETNKNNIVFWGTMYDSDEPGYVNAMDRFNGKYNIYDNVRFPSCY